MFASRLNSPIRLIAAFGLITSALSKISFSSKCLADSGGNAGCVLMSVLPEWNAVPTVARSPNPPSRTERFRRRVGLAKKARSNCLRTRRIHIHRHAACPYSCQSLCGGHHGSPSLYERIRIRVSIPQRPCPQFNSPCALDFLHYLKIAFNWSVNGKLTLPRFEFLRFMPRTERHALDRNSI